MAGVLDNHCPLSTGIFRPMVYIFEDLKDSGPRGFDLSFPVGVPRFERQSVGDNCS